MLQIQVVYRNYIPLNSPYSSFWTNPPGDIRFNIPAPRLWLKRFYPIYRRFGNHALIATAVNVAQKILFKEEKSSAADHDILFYVGMLPSKIPARPFVVDIEHIYSLLNFVKDKAETKKRCLDILTHPNCKAIVPISEAAARSMSDYLEDDYKFVADKTRVIYPALPPYCEVFKDEQELTVIPPRKGDELNILFVGKDAYGKGLPEVLEVFAELYKRYPFLRLYVVTELPDKLGRTYDAHPAIRFFPPKYSAKEIMVKFFLPCDLFVMPTHADTFGMVYLEALACGKPVIATRQFAIPEIVEDGVNGLLLDHPPLFLDRPGLPHDGTKRDYPLTTEEYDAITGDLQKKLQYLIENPKERERLAQAAAKELQSGGRFAIDRRNQMLTDLFQSVME